MDLILHQTSSAPFTWRMFVWRISQKCLRSTQINSRKNSVSLPRRLWKNIELFLSPHERFHSFLSLHLVNSWSYFWVLDQINFSGIIFVVLICNQEKLCTFIVHHKQNDRLPSSYLSAVRVNFSLLFVEFLHFPLIIILDRKYDFRWSLTPKHVCIFTDEALSA